MFLSPSDVSRRLEKSWLQISTTPRYFTDNNLNHVSRVMVRSQFTGFSVRPSPFTVIKTIQSQFTVNCLFTMESVRGHWKTTAIGERPGESRFAIQCSPRRYPFAAPCSICSNVPMFSIQSSLFNVRRAVHHSPSSPRHSPRRSPFAALFAIRLVIHCAVRHSPRRFLWIFPNFRYSNFAIQCSPRR